MVFDSRVHNAQDAVGGPRDGLVEISVIQDDVRALSSEFQGHILQVALRSVLLDLPANDRRTSERDLIDIHVLRDRSTGSLSVAIDDVYDTRWEASLVEELCDAKSRERRELRWLEDDGVSGRECGAKLPGEHEEREIPGNDLPDDANTLVPRVRELGLRGLNASTYSASIFPQ